MLATKLVFMGCSLVAIGAEHHVPAGQKFTIPVLFGSGLPQIIEPKLNSSGHLVEIAGYAPDLLALVSRRWGFNYTWNERSLNSIMDDTRTKKGLISLLLDGEGEVIIGAIVPTPDRFKNIDFTAPILTGAMGILIPYPVQSSNSRAFVQPFELSVWIGILISLGVITATWYGAEAIMTRFGRRRRKSGKIRNIHKPVEYTTRVWLGQGDSLSCHLADNATYFIAGVCCLGAFFVLQAYNCNLLPSILAPMHKPMIRRVFDIANVPGLRVAVSRGLAIDVTFQDVVRENTDTSYTKAIVALQSTIFRCNKTDECLQKVLSNSHVYIHGDFALYHIIAENYKRTGQCQFTMATEALYRGHLTWGLPKNNALLRNVFNIGLLEMNELGMSTYLEQRYIKKPVNCLNFEVKSVQKKPLDLDMLSVAFILLAFGCALSFVAFALEHLTHNLTHFNTM